MLTSQTSARLEMSRGESGYVIDGSKVTLPLFAGGAASSEPVSIRYPESLDPEGREVRRGGR